MSVVSACRSLTRGRLSTCVSTTSISSSSSSISLWKASSTCLSVRFTSSNSTMTRTIMNENEQTVFAIPPNLKIDPRAISSPVYGLERITDTNKEDLEIENEEEEETLYEWNPEWKEPARAIPLPERLQVQVYSFAECARNDNEEEEDDSLVAGSFPLDETVFGMDPIRVDLLQRCVVYLRNKKRGKRNGGARTKTISEVSGSGKKMRQQKESGQARCGHKRPPHWRGGAKAHGPKGSIQDYTTKLNKKVRRLALRHALSQKLLEGNLIVVDTLNSESHKTQHLARALQNLAKIGGRNGTTAYILDNAKDHKTNDSEDQPITSINGVNINTKVASANLFKIKLASFRSANVYDILKYEKLVLSLSAIQGLEQKYGESE